MYVRYDYPERERSLENCGEVVFSKVVGDQPEITALFGEFLKFQQKKEQIAQEEPEKLKDLPRFKCRLCGIGLRCHALLNNDPSLCFGCGACKQFPCPVGALSFAGPSFADSVRIPELLTMHRV